ncbi:MAG: Arc family DNA-binding protein [Gammaproteobacteria bacterium]|nr:Arc family DNA-binding protein [Gammaproteobacteria bacterium]
MSKRKPFALRINEDILNAMQKWADDELRSVNGQIEYVLREALRKNSRLAGNRDDREKSP